MLLDSQANFNQKLTYGQNFVNFCLDGQASQKQARIEKFCIQNDQITALGRSKIVATIDYARALLLSLRFT